MPDVTETRYLIVGGGLAGGSALEAIREHDKEGKVVLVTEEAHNPYDRVPLSKQYLRGEMKREALFLLDEEFYDEKIAVFRSRRADRLDATSRSLVLDNGQQIAYERLLIATGGRPRKLPIPGNELPGVYYLRTVDDSDAIKGAMANGKRAVIVGGGFIGSEIAAACTLKGLETTIIEIGPSLLGMAVDAETAKWVTEHFRQHGVRVFTNTGATKFIEQNGRVASVETSTGEKISCDFAAIGVGIAPNVELAKEAGLPVDNGLVVNDRLEVNSSGVFAAGDVARFYSPIFGKHLRVEHYDVAVKHGKVAGANMAGGQESFSELPYFFSFMFKLRIEVWGHISPEAKVARRGQLELTEKGGFAQFYVKDDKVDAYLSVNRSFKEAQVAQKLILSRRQVQVSTLQDEQTDLASLAA